MPDLYKEFAQLAKENHVTMIGTGVQDVNFANLCLIGTANMLNIRSLHLTNVMCLDAFGLMEINTVGGIGTTEEEFYRIHEGEKQYRNYIMWGLAAISEELGLHITEEIILPEKSILAKEDFICKHNGLIKKGHVSGKECVGVFHTEEGIDLIGSFVFAYEKDGYHDTFLWEFEGDPSFKIEIQDSNPAFSTCVDITNRIPDIFNAPAGYLTTKDLPKPTFKYYPFKNYMSSESRHY